MINKIFTEIGMMVGIRLTIYILSVTMCEAIFEEEVLVKENQGIMLQPTGVIVRGTQASYVSSFIRIENPIKTRNYCTMGCGVRMSDILNLVRLTECQYNENKVAMNATAYREIFIEGNDTTKGLDKDYDNHAKCVQRCLKDLRCKAYGTEQKTNGMLCKLRDKEVTMYKTLMHSREVTMDECLVPNRQRFCKERQDNMTKLMALENEKYVNRTWEELNRFINKEKEEKTRKRRSLGTVLPILGALATGYSIYEIKKLQSHMDEYKKKFEVFKAKEIEFDQQVTKFEGSTLQMFKALENEMEETILQVECKIKTLVYQLLENRRLTSWEHKLQTIYKDIISGNVEGSISATLFNITDIEILLNNTEMLNDTIYHKKPELLYRIGQAHVAGHDIIGKYFNIHIVIKIPVIKTNSFAMVYDILQSGMTRKTEDEISCFKWDIPDTIFKEKERYYKIPDRTVCTDRYGLKLCMVKTANITDEVPCLRNIKSCEIIKTDCKTNIKQSTTGVMVKTDEPVSVVLQTNKKITKSIEKSENGVYFLPFKKYYQIMIGQQNIYSLEKPAEVKMIDLEDRDEWETWLDQEIFEMNKIDMTKSIDILTKQQSIINQMLEEPQYNVHISRLWWMGPIVFSLLAAAIIWYLITRCLKHKIECQTCIKISSRKRQLQNEEEPISLKRLKLEEEKQEEEEELEAKIEPKIEKKSSIHNIKNIEIYSVDDYIKDSDPLLGQEAKI